MAIVFIDSVTLCIKTQEMLRHVREMISHRRRGAFPSFSVADLAVAAMTVS